MTNNDSDNDREPHATRESSRRKDATVAALVQAIHGLLQRYLAFVDRARARPPRSHDPDLGRHSDRPPLGRERRAVGHHGYTRATTLTHH